MTTSTMTSSSTATAALRKPGRSKSQKKTLVASTNDRHGEIEVNNDPPTASDLVKCADLQVLDQNLNPRPFTSLYSGEESTERTLVIFIRHFFCGLCQEYLRALCTTLTPSYLISLPTPISVVIVGHGDPSLIPFYVTETSCPFPIYADPTKLLYVKLGMARTLDLGPKQPDYIQSSFLAVTLRSMVRNMTKIGRGAFSGGDYRQVGGEFVFENEEVVWCHRMRNTRDHAELEEVRQVLGLPRPRPRQQPIRRAGSKRWSATFGAGRALGRSLSQKRASWVFGGRREGRGSMDVGTLTEKREENIGAVTAGVSEQDVPIIAESPRSEPSLSA